MLRRRLLTPHEYDAEDEGIIWALRPRTLDECIGQKGAIERLRIGIEAAKMRGEPLEHMLLYGPPGLGKTTLAHVVANELNVNIHVCSGPTLERAGDLMGYLLSLRRGDILFIDEIHRMPRHVEEFLYGVMDRFVVSFPTSRRVSAKPPEFKLQAFTLIGATTKAGNISRPLRERFGICVRLDFYSVDELTEIVKRSARLLGIPIDHFGAEEIAKRSRGTPRIANRLLRRVRDYAEVKGDGRVTRRIVDEALRMEGIDEHGLDALDRKYLEVLIREYNGGPAGIDAICALLQEDATTLEEMVEPYLLKMGLIKRTPHGRV
ncbi:MAG: Holliday junction branch migration DNA helicase RuvB, partial [Armatimonadetes bacterium]|nr:Holliday junction branch migration DNA helicase RuvB [Armatimonadota bacterium]